MNDLGKVPPQSQDLETVILGSILNFEKLFYKAIEIFKNNNVFYYEPHGLVFESMKKIVNEDGHIDMFTVPEMLSKMGKLEEIGGHVFITKLSQNYKTDISYHCRIIFQKYILRELIRISGDIQRKAYDQTDDCLNLLEKGIDELSDILNMKFDEREEINDIIDNIILESEDILEKGNDNLSLKELISLNKVLTFSERHILFLAAQPKHAKTRFIVMIIKMLFENNNNISLFWKAMEDGKKDVVRHLVTCFKDISYNEQKNKLDQKKIDSIKDVKDLIKNWDMEISQERTVMSIIRSQFIDHVKSRTNKFNILLIDNFNICQDEIKEELTENEKERKVAAEIQKTISIANEYAPSMAIIIDHLNKSQMDPEARKIAYRPKTRHLKGSSRKYEIVTQLVTLNYIAKHKDIISKERGKKIVVNNKEYNREEILKKLLILELNDSRYSSTEDSQALIRFFFDADKMKIKEWKTDNITEETYHDRNIVSMEEGAEKMFKEEFFSIGKIGSWQLSYASVFKKLGDETTDGSTITFDYLKNKYYQYYNYVRSINEEREEKFKQKIKSIKEFIDSSMYEEEFDKNDNMNYYLYGK